MQRQKLKFSTKWLTILAVQDNGNYVLDEGDEIALSDLIKSKKRTTSKRKRKSADHPTPHSLGYDSNTILADGRIRIGMEPQDDRLI